MPFTTQKFNSFASQHPKKFPLALFDYGTSGIRAQGIRLDSTAFRMGIVAGVRSKAFQGKAVGVMITASHNPSDDNGIKIIDTHGSMLDSDWESICTTMANLPNEDLEYYVRGLIETYEATGTCSVFVAMDTRGTSPALCKAVIDGAKILDAEIRNFGQLTTPQLHFIVYEFNRGGQDPTEFGYYTKVSKAFKDLCSSFSGVPTSYVPILHVDCSHGVGSVALKKLLPMLEPFLQVKIHNDHESGIVNFECGSFYIETHLRQPTSVSVNPNEHWASFDGDADRIIYYYRDSSSKLCILNGDKIASLFCLYIKQLLQSMGLDDRLTLQVIQTAYANGRSTEYLRNVVGVHVHYTPTGVKHLLRRTEACDISIWFESNGHGSVCFNSKAYDMVKEKMRNDPTGSAKILLAIFDLMNQATGDAICDFLLVEAILRAKDWEPKDWNALFETYPSRLTSCTVGDRYFIKTNENATEILEPADLQVDINALIASFGQGSRVVVRPSGTEDIVRIYTESASQENADQLAAQVSRLVKEHSLRDV